MIEDRLRSGPHHLGRRARQWRPEPVHSRPEPVDGQLRVSGEPTPVRVLAQEPAPALAQHPAQQRPIVGGRMGRQAGQARPVRSGNSAAGGLGTAEPEVDQCRRRSDQQRAAARPTRLAAATGDPTAERPGPPDAHSAGDSAGRVATRLAARWRAARSSSRTAGSACSAGMLVAQISEIPLGTGRRPVPSRAVVTSSGQPVIRRSPCSGSDPDHQGGHRAARARTRSIPRRSSSGSPPDCASSGHGWPSSSSSRQPAPVVSSSSHQLPASCTGRPNTAAGIRVAQGSAATSRANCPRTSATESPAHVEVDDRLVGRTPEQRPVLSRARVEVQLTGDRLPGREPSHRTAYRSERR